MAWLGEFLLAIICGILCIVFVPGCEPTTVHVVFSNHLDIGFNAWGGLAFDNAVFNTYFNIHFPRAVRLAQEAVLHNSSKPFIFTTHPYILSLYFDCPSGMGLDCPTQGERAAFEAAIKRGDITWHALPHNAQAEMYDPSLLEAAVSMAHSMDDTYGLPHKVTMSQRDIPGLTRAAIPILKSAGVKVLSVGVNYGSSPPAVPVNTPFIWRDLESGEEIIAFWHPGGYGWITKQECTKVEGFDHVLCTAWREDNAGPPLNLEEVLDVYRSIERDFPGADIRVGDFEEYSRLLLEAAPSLNLSVVTGEIGDTWIHGVASDPLKCADYRAALRLRNKCMGSGECSMEDPHFANFTRFLVKIPEHTWGLDTGSGLHDHANWTNAQLQVCLKTHAPNYEDMMYSWARQYRYVKWAFQALGDDHTLVQQFHLDRALRLQPMSVQLGALQTRKEQSTLIWRKGDNQGGKYVQLGGKEWVVGVDTATGAVKRLQRKLQGAAGGEQMGVNWAGGEGSAFLQLQYSTYIEQDYLDFVSQYYYPEPPVSGGFYSDFCKPNVSSASPKRANIVGTLEEIHDTSSGGSLDVHMRYSFPDWAVQDAGAPVAMWVRAHEREDSEPSHRDSHTAADSDADHRSAGKKSVLSLEVGWEEKTATRLPEALWVVFKLDPEVVDKSSWRLNKLGSWIDPLDVILNGSHSLHAVNDDGVYVKSLPPSHQTFQRRHTLSQDTAWTSGNARATADDGRHIIESHHNSGQKLRDVRGGGERRVKKPHQNTPQERLQIRSLDVPLVSPGKATPFPNVNSDPDMEEGVSFNLVNNIWGTNWIMWFPWTKEQASMRFRFELISEEDDQPTASTLTQK